MPDLRRQATRALDLPVEQAVRMDGRRRLRNPRPTSSEYARRMSRQEFVSLMRAGAW